MPSIVNVTERHLYGSSRLGILSEVKDAKPLKTQSSSLAYLSTFIRGNKVFELSNHLGNVLVTVSDKKLQHTTDGTTVDYYTADVISAQDYYPFGMTMPGRKFNSSKLLNGFNGKRYDNDIYGEGNFQDYGARVYDPRIGRLNWSVDPLTTKYPELTPYQFASNRPIQGVDLDGKEVFLVTGSGTGYMTFFGADAGAGIAFGRDGIALVAFQTYKIGFGLELSASVNGTLYPTMQKLDDLGGLSLGVGVAGAYLGKFGVGVNKSSGHWGATGSVGVGVGGHISFDMSISGLKVIKWEEIVSKVKETTDQGKALAAFFGINESNVNNAVSIIKDFYKTMATGLRGKRISDLQNENTKNSETIKSANEYLKDYKNSSKLYKLFNFFTKKQVEQAKASAEKNTQKNNEEIKTLKNTTIPE